MNVYSTDSNSECFINILFYEYNMCEDADVCKAVNSADSMNRS